MICLVITTFETQDQAKEMANKLVELKMAACVQIVGPITSTYIWKGKLETTTEWRCEIKTTQAKFPELEKAISDNHPYELPEIVMIPIVSSNAAYFDWVCGAL